MCCKRCRVDKKDMVRVDNLVICCDCINLIVLEWGIRLEGAMDILGVCDVHSMVACRSCFALPSMQNCESMDVMITYRQAA